MLNARSATADGTVTSWRRRLVRRCSHAIELGVLEARARDDVGEQREGLRAESRERRDGEKRGVGSDFGLELRADPRERFVQCERAEIARALVQHVARQRRQPGAIGRIGRRSHAHEQHHRLQGDVAVLHGPQREAVGQPRLVNRRERERRVGTERGLMGAIDHVSAPAPALSR